MRNCIASVVLPEPGTPSTKYRRLGVNPPRRMSSMPAMPELAGDWAIPSGAAGAVFMIASAGGGGRRPQPVCQGPGTPTRIIEDPGAHFTARSADVDQIPCHDEHPRGASPPRLGTSPDAST